MTIWDSDSLINSSSLNLKSNKNVKVYITYFVLPFSSLHYLLTILGHVSDDLSRFGLVLKLKNRKRKLWSVIVGQPETEAVVCAVDTQA